LLPERIAHTGAKTNVGFVRPLWSSFREALPFTRTYETGGRCGVQQKIHGRIPLVGEHGNPVQVDVPSRWLVSNGRIGVDSLKAHAPEGFREDLHEPVISGYRVNVAADGGFDPTGFAWDGPDADPEA